MLVDKRVRVLVHMCDEPGTHRVHPNVIDVPARVLIVSDHSLVISARPKLHSARSLRVVCGDLLGALDELPKISVAVSTRDYQVQVVRHVAVRSYVKARRLRRARKLLNAKCHEPAVLE